MTGTPPTAPDLTPQQRMRTKVSSPEGRTVYRLRKCIPEPVFGQIKEARGFRRFSFRGLAKATAEWTVVDLTHNLLKLFRSGWKVAAVSPSLQQIGKAISGA